MAGKAEEIRNPQRIVFPVAKFTKRDVMDFYAAIAQFIVPHLKGHPATLKRYPDVAPGPFFWEKDAPAFTPKWVKTFGVWRRTGESQINYILVNDARTLLWAVNAGTLEFHPFLAKAPDMENPVSIVFDLDPGEGAHILRCSKVALLLRDVLARLQLQSFVKVSGSKGLQVIVPLNTRTTYAVTQPFAKTVAELLASENPELIVAEMAKEYRQGKVFIDWSQNADYKTTVAVYSLRAKRHHPYVSMPVTWEEVEFAAKERKPTTLYFPPEMATERVAKMGDLFAPVLKLKQELPAEFVKQLAPKGTRSAAPVRRKQTAPRASEQGGKRQFAIVGDELWMQVEEEIWKWKLPVRKTKSFETVVVRAKSDAAWLTRLLRADRAADAGTYELVEGSFERGEVVLFFAGKTWNGEWTVVMDANSSTWNRS